MTNLDKQSLTQIITEPLYLELSAVLLIITTALLADESLLRAWLGLGMLASFLFVIYQLVFNNQ